MKVFYPISLYPLYLFLHLLPHLVSLSTPLYFFLCHYHSIPLSYLLTISLSHHLCLLISISFSPSPAPSDKSTSVSIFLFISLSLYSSPVSTMFLSFFLTIYFSIQIGLSPSLYLCLSHYLSISLPVSSWQPSNYLSLSHYLFLFIPVSFFLSPASSDQSIYFSLSHCLYIKPIYLPISCRQLLPAGLWDPVCSLDGLLPHTDLHPLLPHRGHLLGLLLAQQAGGLLALCVHAQ